jgi:hypothetical protein
MQRVTANAVANSPAETSPGANFGWHAPIVRIGASARELADVARACRVAAACLGRRHDDARDWNWRLGVVPADELSRLGPAVHPGLLKDRRGLGV